MPGHRIVGVPEYPTAQLTAPQAVTVVQVSPPENRYSGLVVPGAWHTNSSQQSICWHAVHEVMSHPPGPVHAFVAKSATSVDPVVQPANRLLLHTGEHTPVQIGGVAEASHVIVPAYPALQLHASAPFTVACVESEGHVAATQHWPVVQMDDVHPVAALAASYPRGHANVAHVGTHVGPPVTTCPSVASEAHDTEDADPMKFVSHCAWHVSPDSMRVLFVQGVPVPPPATTPFGNAYDAHRF